ncbi:MAG: hypothetical protein QOG27_1739 [Verrucomicrobiota bacterium]
MLPSYLGEGDSGDDETDTKSCWKHDQKRVSRHKYRRCDAGENKQDATNVAGQRARFGPLHCFLNDEFDRTIRSSQRCCASIGTGVA